VFFYIGVMVPRNKAELLAWLDKRPTIAPRAQMTLGQLCIHRVDTGRYSVIWEKGTILATGRIPSSSNMEVFPIEIAKTIVRQLDIP
jgi:hypothetical protein